MADLVSFLKNGSQSRYLVSTIVEATSTGKFSQWDDKIIFSVNAELDGKLIE